MTHMFCRHAAPLATPMALSITVMLAGSATVSIGLDTAEAQTSGTGQPLPPVVVEQPAQPSAKPKPKKTAKKIPSAAAKPKVEAAAPAPQAAAAQPAEGEAAGGEGEGVGTSAGAGSPSLTSPGVGEARRQIEKTPGGVAVVDAKAYEDTAAVTVKEVLDYVPGVFVQPRDGGQDVKLSIRGSGLARNFHLRGLTLLQDGVPINNADGFADFQIIDPLGYRYVEVYKGANALRYGGTTLGGAVNFVTSSGYDAEAALGRVEAGSFDLKRVHASSGQVIGASDYFISFSARETDGFRDFNESDAIHLFANIGHKITPSLETHFYINATDSDSELPGNLTRKQLEEEPTRANLENKTGKMQNDANIVRLANKTTWHSDGIVVTGGAYMQLTSRFHPIFQVFDQQFNDYGVFFNATLTGAAGDWKNELTFGTNLSMGTLDTNRSINCFLFPFFAGCPGGHRGVLVQDTEDESRTAVAYVEDRLYPAENFALIAGSSFTYTERIRDGAAFTGFTGAPLAGGPRDLNDEKDYRGASPKIGALWQAAPGVQVFSNLSRSFEAPDFIDLGQNLPGDGGLADLEAQRATTVEIGTRGDWAGLAWDVSLYRAWIDNELLFFTLTGGNPGESFTFNAGETIHQGIELGLGANIAHGVATQGDKVSFRTAYTFNDFFFANDAQFGDNELPGLPRHYIRAELRYAHPTGVYVAPNVEVSPESYAIDFANSLSNDPYWLLGVQAGWQINEHAKLWLEARNLTDEVYAAATDVILDAGGNDQSVFYPGDGRAVYVGLTVK